MRNFFQKNNNIRLFFYKKQGIEFFLHVNYCIISKKMYFCKALKKRMS